MMIVLGDGHGGYLEEPVVVRWQEEKWELRKLRFGRGKGGGGGEEEKDRKSSEKKDI